MAVRPPTESAADTAHANPPGPSQISLPASAEALLTAIVSSSDDAIVSKNFDGIVTSWNKGAERIFGYTAEEMIGQPIARLACVGNEDDLRQVLDKVRRGERVDHYETRRRRKDGTEITVSLTVSPIHDESGKIIGASKVVRDVSSRLAAEEALRKAEQLAVVGRMAASIAHEINNPLESVINLLYLLSTRQLDPEAQEFVRLALQEIQRVSDITSRTLSFYRNSQEATLSSVSQVLSDALTLHRGRMLALKVELRSKQLPVPEISFNQVELRQVFANVVGNALEAMESGGTLYTRVRSGTDWATGRHGVRVTIADTGIGMSPQTLLRLFEPFYTTKGARGTGLGLWITEEIVQKNKGRITVKSSQSAPFHGTVFSLFLPTCET